MEKRILQGEIMDDPNLDSRSHAHALSGLTRINYFSRTWTAVWRPIRQLALSADKPLSVLDVACGGGDLLIRMANQSVKESLPISFTGLDVSQTAIELATKSAVEQDAQVDFRVGNAADLARGPKFDVVCSTLFLHHLPASEAINLLNQMKAVANQLVVVQDLLRTKTGYWLAKVVPRILTSSKIVHVDGVRSVLSAFTIDEAKKLAEAADLKGASIRNLWPQRFLLLWDRPQSGES